MREDGGAGQACGGPTEQESLLQRHTHVQKRRALFNGLYASGYHPHPELIAQRNHVGNDALAGSVQVHTTNQADAEFEQIWLEVRQKVQSRLSRAEVIDGGQKTPRTVRLQSRQQMAMISNLVVFGYLEDDVGQRPAYAFRHSQGCPQAVIRVVEGVRQEIDGHQRRQHGFNGTFHRPHSARLVKRVLVSRVDRRQNLLSRCPVNPPHQSFMGKHGPRRNIRDGLERRSNAPLECFAVAARIAYRLFGHLSYFDLTHRRRSSRLKRPLA